MHRNESKPIGLKSNNLNALDIYSFLDLSISKFLSISWLTFNYRLMAKN